MDRKNTTPSPLCSGTETSPHQSSRALTSFLPALAIIIIFLIRCLLLIDLSIVEDDKKAASTLCVRLRAAIFLLLPSILIPAILPRSVPQVLAPNLLQVRVTPLALGVRGAGPGARGCGA